MKKDFGKIMIYLVMIGLVFALTGCPVVAERDHVVGGRLQPSWAGGGSSENPGSNTGIVGTWELRISENDFIEMLMYMDNISRQEAEAEVATMKILGMTFPAVMYEIVFTSTTWTAYDVDPKDGTRDKDDEGTYTISGNTVTMQPGNITGIISGSNLTIDGEVFTKR